MNETIELFNKYYDRSLAVISPGKVIVLSKDQQQISKIQSISLDQSEKGTYVHIKSNILFTSQLTQEDRILLLLQLKTLQHLEIISRILFQLDF